MGDRRIVLVGHGSMRQESLIRIGLVAIKTVSLSSMNFQINVVRHGLHRAIAKMPY